MEARIQFRVDEETKRLAQQMAQSQGRTLSDACRELTEQLAVEQKKVLSQDSWLSEQVNLAFEKFDDGESVFVDNETAKARMADFKARIRDKSPQ